MKSILSVFWHICTFRSGPDRLPANATFLFVVVTANILLNISLFMLLNDVSWLKSVTLVVVNVAAVAVLVWAIMSLMQLSARYQQTITALFGADLILTSITNFATWLLQDALPTEGSEAAANGAITPSWEFFVIVFLILWNIGVNGFVMHRSLEVHIAAGVVIALFTLIFALAIAQSVIAL